jgi:hypothetical protein
MIQAQVISELRELKDKAVAASAVNDRDFYESYLDDAAVAILPLGMLRKEQVLASMTGEKAPFAAKRIEEEKILPLGSDAGIVTYKATNDGPKGEFSVLATTVYAKRGGRWRGMLYQQTPLGDNKTGHS